MFNDRDFSSYLAVARGLGETGFMQLYGTQSQVHKAFGVRSDMLMCPDHRGFYEDGVRSLGSAFWHEHSTRRRVIEAAGIEIITSHSGCLFVEDKLRQNGKEAGPSDVERYYRGYASKLAKKMGIQHSHLVFAPLTPYPLVYLDLVGGFSPAAVRDDLPLPPGWIVSGELGEAANKEIEWLIGEIGHKDIGDPLVVIMARSFEEADAAKASLLSRRNLLRKQGFNHFSRLVVSD